MSAASTVISSFTLSQACVALVRAVETANPRLSRRGFKVMGSRGWRLREGKSLTSGGGAPVSIENAVAAATASAHSSMVDGLPTGA